MRIIIIILIVVACQMSGQSQNQIIPLNKKRSFRLTVGTGFSISSSTSQIKDHLINSGFGNKYNGSFDYLTNWVLFDIDSDDSDDFYPQSQSVPVVAELTLERRIGKRVWLGIMAGIDKSESVEGYDRHGTEHTLLKGTYSIGQFLTMEHSSWFLSPQFSIDRPDNKLNFFGGPTFEFHSLSISREGQGSVYSQPTKIGAVIGMKAKIKSGWEWMAAYRFSPSVQYGESLNTFQDEDKSYISNLPAEKINFSHFRTGLAYRFPW